MSDILFYVAGFAVLAVAVVLAFGIGTFGKGGEASAKQSNKLMKYRLIAQAVAVVLILIAIFVRQNGG